MKKTTSENDKKTASEKDNDKKNVVIRTAIKAGQFHYGDWAGVE